MTITRPLSRDIAQAVEALGQNMACSEPFLVFRTAEQALVADGPASSLLRELSQLQAELRQRQNREMLPMEDLERLRRLQAAVQANPTIADFFRAQQEVSANIQEINQEVSSLLGVDFAGLARVSSC